MKRGSRLSRRLFGFGLICLLITLAYWGVWNFELVWDDFSFISEWVAPRDIRNWGAFFKGELPLNQEGVYRPIRSIFYGISWYLYSGEASFYHIQALLVYLVLVGLVILIAGELTYSTHIGLLAGLIFGIHPIHVESVAWVTASFDGFGLGFLLASYWLYLLFARTQKSIYYFTSLFTAGLAYFSYELTLVLPLLLMITDYFFPQKTQTQARRFYWLPYIALVGVYVWVRMGWLSIHGRGSYLTGDMASSVLYAIGLIPRYMAMLMLPLALSVNHHLGDGVMAYFSQEYAPGDLIQILPWRWGLSVGVVLVCGVMLWISRRKPEKYTYLQWGWWWMIATLIPVMQFFPQSSLFSERYLFITSVGFSIAAAYYLIQFGARPQGKWLVKVFIAVIVTVYWGLTFQRVQHWQDSITLWESEITRIAPTIFAYTNLAEAYDNEGQREMAKQVYAKAIQLNPDANLSWEIEGILALEAGEYLLAQENFDKVLSIRPDHVRILTYYGLLHYRQGRYEEAKSYYEKARQFDPDDAMANYYEAMNEHAQGNYGEAEKLYLTAIDIRRDYVDAYVNLGNLYQDMNDQIAAIKQYKVALELDPGNEHALKRLVELEK